MATVDSASFFFRQPMFSLMNRSASSNESDSSSPLVSGKMKHDSPENTASFKSIQSLNDRSKKVSEWVLDIVQFFNFKMPRLVIVSFHFFQVELYTKRRKSWWNLKMMLSVIAFLRIEVFVFTKIGSKVMDLISVRYNLPFYLQFRYNVIGCNVFLYSLQSL